MTPEKTPQESDRETNPKEESTRVVPREFWCLPSRQQDIRHGFKPIGSITDVEPPPGTEYIHVIEISAVTELEKAVESLKKDVEMHARVADQCAREKLTQDETITEMRKALEFYADEKNWAINAQDKLHTQKLVIKGDSDSFGYLTVDGNSILQLIGGKLARKTLAKLRGE